MSRRRASYLSWWLGDGFAISAQMNEADEGKNCLETNTA